MIVNAINNLSSDMNKPMHALINPDMDGYWAVRYVWIQHKTDNENFLRNYFKKQTSDAAGLNVRKNTTHLQKYWDTHNKIFELAKNNGELVYRIKIENLIAESIDYIEIWKNTELIKNYFMFEDENVILQDKTVWTISDKRNLSCGVFDSGFISRNWYPIPTISRTQALSYYKHFVQMAIEHKNCVINTKFNSALHS